MTQSAVDLRHAFGKLPALSSAVTVGLLTLLYLIRQWALPKPLPGIPFNEAAARIILGDANEVRKIRQAGGRARAWFGQQTVKHNSPIVQAFLTPLGKPAIILSDYREAQDILLRRGKEFDRGTRNLEAFRGVLPWHHIAMTTSDPQFKKNRELVKDLMTHQFLNTVSAPEIYRNALEFIELWKLKAELANGQPFRADDDIHIMAFDIIKAAVALGEGDSASMVEAYEQRIRDSNVQEKKKQDGAERDQPFEFPTHEPNVDLETHMVMQEAVGIAVTQPWPKIFNFFHQRTNKMREAHANKERMLGEQVELALKRMQANENGSTVTNGNGNGYSDDKSEQHGVRSALDHMIRRELAAAAKAGRAPVFNSPSMYDELYGYIGAGHDTTSTTMQWVVKYLAKYPAAQDKLRANLHEALSDALREGRQPDVSEITAKISSSQMPYLDAIIEETLRLNGPVPTLLREATVDTVVLGHPVPKGTMIFFDITGPSILKPSIPVDESKRSETSQRHADARGNWDGMEPQEFLPERWLREKNGKEQASGDEGVVYYDPQAGPILTFSTGVRGCFGRRLAYLQLRIVIVLMIWNFELGALPEALNDWGVIESMTIKPAKCFVRLTEVSPSLA